MNLRTKGPGLVSDKDDRYSWTEEDELNLLEYLRQTVLDNKSIEVIILQNNLIIIINNFTEVEYHVKYVI